LNLESDDLAIKHYSENKDRNLIFSALFINPINVCKRTAYKVFDFDIDMDVVDKTITNVTPLDCKVYFIELSRDLSTSTTIQLNKTSSIYNIIDSFYVFPPDFKITSPINNKTIKYFISIPDAKFIITTHVISEKEALLVIRRSDCDWGWNENLYLDLIDNELDKNEYFYIGKSCENIMKVVIVTGDEMKFKSANLDYVQKIPKKIFQTWKCPVSKMNKEMLNTVLGIQEMNPEYEYKLFDDTECYEYIKTNFDKDILFAYTNLIPSAFKADLFRYCILYKEGGIYIDCKMICVVPFREFIDADDELILVDDLFQKQISNFNGKYNAFICAVKGQQIFKKSIDEIVNNVNTLNFPNNPMMISGPPLLDSWYTKLAPTCKLLQHPYLGLHHTNHNNGIFFNNKLIIYKTFKNYYKSNFGGKYIHDYKIGNVYNNTVDLFKIYECEENSKRESFTFEYDLKSLMVIKRLLQDFKIVDIIIDDESTILSFGSRTLPSKLTLVFVANEFIIGENFTTLF
jgi:hypothetical protein